MMGGFKLVSYEDDEDDEPAFQINHNLPFWAHQNM